MAHVVLDWVPFEVPLNCYFFAVWYPITNTTVLVIHDMCRNYFNSAYIHKLCCSIDSIKGILSIITSVFSTHKSTRSGQSFWYICVIGGPSRIIE